MTYRVEVIPKIGQAAPAASGLVGRIRELGIEGVETVSLHRLFFLDGQLADEDVRLVADELLADDVIETYRIFQTGTASETRDELKSIEVSCKPGVTDTVGETLLATAQQLGLSGLEQAATATRYCFTGRVSTDELNNIAKHLLANEVVEQWSVDQWLEPPFTSTAHGPSVIAEISISELDEVELLAISTERRLSLNLEEMKAIQSYYRSENREPTEMELEMLAQTWSEHCVHKTFKARIDFVELENDGRVVESTRRTIDSMFDSFLKAATKQAQKPWIKSVFVDNAGIVAFDEEFDIALKVETHNHPSALEPFGGANTGVGGVVRDILGVSARPIANTDVLCFGLQDTPHGDLPDGVMHPRRIAHGVVAGVEDYGNKMGIPTVNGAIIFEPGYTANPLVFCGCLGILPAGSHKTDPQIDDRVVVLGGRTGRDGIGGATFSSMEMSHETGEIAGSSVQIGHPINEKQVQEVVCEARDAGLYNAITDCGAGGLSSSVGEMAEKLGASIQLEDVPLKYPGLQPWEIWLSEAQERMVMAVPDHHWSALKEICRKHGVDATSIGRFTGDGILTVAHGQQPIGRLTTSFLHDGIPQRKLSAEWTRQPTRPLTLEIDDHATLILDLVGSPNLCSREAVIRQYDHEVQGGTVVKPLVGPACEGPGNASVIVPMAARMHGRVHRGVVLGCGVNPHFAKLDPFAMAWSAVDEAVRNVVSVGGDPAQLSLLDNFCWGNPNKPDRLAGLVLACEGCHDGAIDFNAPFISGKDSLNNEYTGADGEKHAIPGTILVTAMAIVPDVRATTTSDIKNMGHHLIIVGKTRDELGGSAAARELDLSGGTVPQRVDNAFEIAKAVHSLIRGGVALSCHDCSEGGLAVAIAEMAIGGQLGCTIDLAAVPTEGSVDVSHILFSESNARYVVEVADASLNDAQRLLSGIEYGVVGRTGGDDVSLMNGPDLLASMSVSQLRERHLRPVL
ncbi:MAG: phosphoribosylformylglycinamidine synthase subunit PurL [Myxococcota bacterium]|nr:phosphoribosylformylglycinamidine synthase subunit PurL [Myxococcota bacterium]